MERIWIVSELHYDQRASIPQNLHAELHCVRDIAQLRQELAEGERPLLLAPLPVLERAREEFPKALAMNLLPPDLSQERLLFAVRAILSEAKVQHELEAAENVAWHSGTGGKYDDPSIELLGSSILELSAARDMASVERALWKACSQIAPIVEVRVHAYPETASARVIGLYKLAVPVQFQGALKAHIYVRFSGEPGQEVLDEVGEALLNLSDAVALAVERNIMIAKAEETKTVWESSFDAVEDPVAILGADLRVLRGNRAYARFAKVAVERLPGRGTVAASAETLRALPPGQPNEWDVEWDGHHYRVFFDTIQEPLGAGRYVLRFHDITEERTLTEKILAKEQVAELGVLVGSVAHEINNPIGGILAIGQILQKDTDPASPLGQDVANIVQSAERCRKIIQTMLSLVRKADEERRAVFLADSLQSALDLLQSEARRLMARLRLNLPGEAREAQVLGNGNRILQVFFHLLQQSLLAIAERAARQPFDPFLQVEVIPGFEHVEVRIEDNGDAVKHEYEIQSSVAFTVSRMILEEHEASYFFVKNEGRNLQRIVFRQSGERSG